MNKADIEFLLTNADGVPAGTRKTASAGGSNQI